MFKITKALSKALLVYSIAIAANLSADEAVDEVVVKGKVL